MLCCSPFTTNRLTTPNKHLDTYTHTSATLWSHIKKMATKASSPPLKHQNNNVADEEEEEEDYIDMEVNSSSSPQIREFEFQMASISVEKEPSTSPADELFYRGKLLPLHLPPRLQMVQKLLQTTTSSTTTTIEEENFCSMPFISTATSSTTPSTNTSTPLESCNISPSESCRVSCELNPDDCYFEWSTELSTFINNHPKKSWSKKLKLVKQSLISEKLKASKAYLKGLFSKSGCSDESCAKAASCNNPETDQQYLNGKDLSNKYMKVAMKPSLAHVGKCTHPTIGSVIKNAEKDGVDDNVNNHRRSFSAAIKRHSPTKCLSSSSSFSSGSSSSSSSSSIAFISNGCYELNFLKRSSSDTSEIEGSIEAAIAHCKKSQELSNSRKPLSETGICSMSAPKIVACEVQGRQGACSI